MSFYRSYGTPGREKTAANEFLMSSPGSGLGIINVEFDDDMMSVQLTPTSTVHALKGMIYEQTFVPPAMQSLYACIHGAAIELEDSESLDMVPTSQPLAMTMAMEEPQC